jgi:hypothetical protein
MNNVCKNPIPSESGVQVCHVCRFDFWKSDEGARLAILMDEDGERCENVVEEQNRDVQPVQNYDEIKSSDSIATADSDVSRI